VIQVPVYLRRQEEAMQIPVVAGVGRGRTPVSALDAALDDCGVASFNVIRVGPVIPPGSMVFESDRVCLPACEEGDRLYSVVAERLSAIPGRAIAAGIGWYQWRGGRGVFAAYDAEGDSTVEVEAEVMDRIHASLRDLSERRGVSFHGKEAGCRIATTEVGEVPAAVAILAIYESDRW
jgi:pyruvoyl-dependent arginine decarboxylase